MTNPYGHVQDDALDIIEKEITPPFYMPNTMYEITIAPADATQMYKHDDRLNEVVELYRKKFLRDLAPCADYCLIVEVTEPNICREERFRPRIHFHGTMFLREPIKFLTEHLHKLQYPCSIAINPYRPDYWPEYILKQKDLIQPLLGKRYWLTHKDTEITPYGNPALHSSASSDTKGVQSPPALEESAGQPKRASANERLQQRKRIATRSVTTRNK